MRISDWSSDVCSSDLACRPSKCGADYCPFAQAPCTERPLSRSHSFRNIQLRKGQAAARLNATGAAIAFRTTRTGGPRGVRRGAIDTPWDTHRNADITLCQSFNTLTVVDLITATKEY